MQEIGRKNIKQEDIQPGSMYTLLQQPLKFCKYRLINTKMKIIVQSNKTN